MPKNSLHPKKIVSQNLGDLRFAVKSEAQWYTSIVSGATVLHLSPADRGNFTLSWSNTNMQTPTQTSKSHKHKPLYTTDNCLCPQGCRLHSYSPDEAGSPELSLVWLHPADPLTSCLLMVEVSLHYILRLILIIPVSPSHFVLDVVLM